MHDSLNPQLVRELKRTLAILALLACMAGQPLVAAEILDFTDLSGNDATGQLILDQPIGVAQTPAVGSYFNVLSDRFSSGEITFSLAVFEWGSGSLEGFSVAASDGTGAFLSFGATLLYPTAAYTVEFATGPHFAGPPIQGDGIWTLSSVPDAAETSVLLAISLAALGVAARRFRPVAP